MNPGERIFPKPEPDAEDPGVWLVEALSEKCRDWDEKATKLRHLKDAYAKPGEPRGEIAEWMATAWEVAASDVAGIVLKFHERLQCSTVAGVGLTDEPEYGPDVDPLVISFKEREDEPVILVGVHEDPEGNLYAEAKTRVLIPVGDAQAMRQRAAAHELHVLHIPKLSEPSAQDVKTWTKLMRPALHHGARLARALLSHWLR